MMPNNCIGLVLFPYDADVYYADLTQTAWGDMASTWTYSRTIKCQVVNVYEDSSNDRPMLLENQRRFQEWDESFVVRTLDNVLLDGATHHTPERTLITNIKTSGGKEYWNSFVTGEPLRLEIRGMIQILDPFENLHHYKITGVVSEDQSALGVT